MELVGLPGVAARTPLRRRPLTPRMTTLPGTITIMMMVAHLQGMKEEILIPHHHLRTMAQEEVV